MILPNVSNIFSRAEMEAAIIENPNIINEFAIISMTDPEMKHVKGIKKGQDVLRLKFWDIEENFCNLKTISGTQAKEIAGFIVKNKSRIFITQCEAGQSRSSSVAEAIECILEHNGDIESFDSVVNPLRANPRFDLNKKVRNTIVSVFDKKRDAHNWVKCPSCSLNSQKSKLVSWARATEGEGLCCPECFTDLP